MHFLDKDKDTQLAPAGARARILPSVNERGFSTPFTDHRVVGIEITSVKRVTRAKYTKLISDMPLFCHLIVQMPSRRRSPQTVSEGGPR